MDIKNMKVRSRLAIGFGLVLALLVAIAAMGLFRMAQIENRLEEIVNINNVEANLAREMRFSVYDRMVALRNLIILSEDAEQAPEAERLKAQHQVYAQAQDKLNRMFNEIASTSQEEKDLMARLRQVGEAAQAVMDKAARLALEKRGAEAAAVLINELRPVQRQWQQALEALIGIEERLSAAALKNAQASYASARNMTIGLSLLAIILGVGAATAITLSLVRQLGGEPGYAAEVAGRIADGDLGTKIALRAGDRGSMMAALKAMQDNLASIVSQVRSGSDSISTASTQIAAGNQDLSSRTEQQASSLEETASSMEELTTAVRQNADSAYQASDLARKASGIAHEGGAVVSQVVDTMGSINDSAKRIADIIGLIDGIAFQTNILALNAAVEAARAGEQGRGFAVVASEVRNLAQRSASAAKEIKALIDDSSNKVETGSKLVDQAGQTMTEIVASIARVAEIMEEITAAGREQSAGIEQVNQAIAQMDQVTQQNAALVEEAASASEAMQEQAHALARLVGTFRLGNEGQAKAAAALPAKPVAPAKPARAAARQLQASRPADGSAVARIPQNRPVAAGGDDWEEF